MQDDKIIKARCILQAITTSDIDFVDQNSSCKILSGRWVKLVSESAIPPSPKYLYSIHAINNAKQDNDIWLHTHGLNRCGSVELEIIGAAKESYNLVGNIIETVATSVIYNGLIRPKEPLPIGKNIIITWQKW